MKVLTLFCILALSLSCFSCDSHLNKKQELKRSEVNQIDVWKIHSRFVPSGWDNVNDSTYILIYKNRMIYLRYPHYSFMDSLVRDSFHKNAFVYNLFINKDYEHSIFINENCDTLIFSKYGGDGEIEAFSRDNKMMDTSTFFIIYSLLKKF